MALAGLCGRGQTPYRQVIVTRIVVSSALMVLGVAAVVIATAFRASLSSDFFRGVYTGTGGGVFAAGLMILVSCLSVIRNQAKMARQEIEEKDERNIYIATKASSLAFYINLFAGYLAILVAGILSEQMFGLLLIVATVQLGIWATIWLILRRVY